MRSAISLHKFTHGESRDERDEECDFVAREFHAGERLLARAAERTVARDGAKRGGVFGGPHGAGV